MRNEKDKEEEIKKDIIKNLDMIAHRIYLGLETTFSNWKPRDPKASHIKNLIRLLRQSQEIKLEKLDLDRHLGKKPKPEPVEKNGKLEEYLEVDLNSICSDIPIANEIFRTGYRLKVYKDDFHEYRLPLFIYEILEHYQDLIDGDRILDDDDTRENIETETLQYIISKRNYSRMWLACIAAVGFVRYQKKALEPYYLSENLTKYTKKFLKNLGYLCDMLHEEKHMVDPDNVGFDLWDVMSTLKKRNIKFLRKKR